MSKSRQRIVLQLALAAIGYAALVLGAGPKAFAGSPPTLMPGHLTMVDGLPVLVCDCTAAPTNCACLVNKQPT